MKYKFLGNSELKVSDISFGCMSLDVNSSQNTAILQKAYESGINFFDTADLYDQGQNESCVGEALKDVRNNVIIATKVGNQWNAAGTAWTWNPTKEYILKAVEQSLKRLQTDYIDLYQLHGGTMDDPIDEVIETFELLKEQGKIRAYGISSIRPNVIREWVKRSNISTVMMQFSLLDRRAEESCFEVLFDSGVSVLARGVFAKGLLIDKAPKAYIDYSEEDIRQLQTALFSSLHPQAVALRFVLQEVAIGSAVIGIRTEEQLDALLKAYTINVHADEIQEVLSILPALCYQEHR